MKVAVNIFVGIQYPAPLISDVSTRIEKLRAAFFKEFQKAWGTKIDFTIEMNAYIGKRDQMMHNDTEVKGVFIKVFVEDPEYILKLTETSLCAAYMLVFPIPDYEVKATAGLLK